MPAWRVSSGLIRPGAARLAPWVPASVGGDVVTSEPLGRLGIGELLLKALEAGGRAPHQLRNPGAGAGLRCERRAGRSAARPVAAVVLTSNCSYPYAGRSASPAAVLSDSGFALLSDLNQS